MGRGHFTNDDISSAFLGEDPVVRMYIGSQPDDPIFVFFDPLDPESLLINYDAADS